MAWPNALAYSEAIQNLRATCGDDELRAGEVSRNALGLPMPYSGNFADVYQVACPATGDTWAVKCFTRETPGLEQRYASIQAHLRDAALPFTVGFEYVRQGLQIAGD